MSKMTTELINSWFKSHDVLDFNVSMQPPSNGYVNANTNVGINIKITEVGMERVLDDYMFTREMWSIFKAFPEFKDLYDQHKLMVTLK